MKDLIGYLTGFTAKFYLAVIVALLACVPLAYCKGRSDGRALERADRAAVVAQAVQDARKADAAALAAAQAGKVLSGAEIERGRDAAAKSDDPWAAAVEAMR